MRNMTQSCTDVSGDLRMNQYYQHIGRWVYPRFMAKKSLFGKNNETLTLLKEVSSAYSLDFVRQPLQTFVLDYACTRDWRVQYINTGIRVLAYACETNERRRSMKMIQWTLASENRRAKNVRPVQQCINFRWRILRSSNALNALKEFENGLLESRMLWQSSGYWWEKTVKKTVKPGSTPQQYLNCETCCVVAVHIPDWASDVHDLLWYGKSILYCRSCQTSAGFASIFRRVIHENGCSDVTFDGESGPEPLAKAQKVLMTLTVGLQTSQNVLLASCPTVCSCFHVFLVLRYFFGNVHHRTYSLEWVWETLLSPKPLPKPPCKRWADEGDKTSNLTNYRLYFCKREVYVQEVSYHLADDRTMILLSQSHIV